MEIQYMKSILDSYSNNEIYSWGHISVVTNVYTTEHRISQTTPCLSPSPKRNKQ